MSKNRNAPCTGASTIRRTTGLRAPPVDPKKLPPITIDKPSRRRRSPDTREKYEIKVDGELFQEIWIAPDLSAASDLDPVPRLRTQDERTMQGKG